MTKLNPESTTEETTEEKNKIIEEIKSLKLGIPEKLNDGDIVYKEDRDLGKKLTILQQSEGNIENAKKLKNFFKNQETVNELNDFFSKNNGMHLPDGKIQESFLKDKKSRDFNEKTYEFDKEKVAKSSIKDVNRNLFSIKGNNSKYIIKSQDKVGEELEKLLENESTKDAFTKIIKNDMKVDINTLCSFPGQSTQGNAPILLSKSGLFSENTLSTYSVSINDNGTIDLTVRDIYISRDVTNPGNVLPVAIEEKTVFHLNKQGDEYVPITPLEAQVNVYDADVLVDEKGDLCALKTHEKVTSIDWKNDEVKNNKIKK